MNRRLIITLPCKYFIRVWLENNCGHPVDLSVFPDLQFHLKNILTKDPVFLKRTRVLHWGA